MIDWLYHLVLRPVLFSMQPEDARRSAMSTIGIVARTSAGRNALSMLGPGRPPQALERRLFGLTFPSPLGLAPGIDIDAQALAGLQQLGFGFLQVGPVGACAVHPRGTEAPIRIAEQQALVSSPQACGASAARIAKSIRNTPGGLVVPVGIALRGAELVRAIRALDRAGDFISVSFSFLDSDVNSIRALRSATSQPLLLRIPIDLERDARTRLLRDVADVGWDGCIVGGARSSLLGHGVLDGPRLKAHSLAVVRVINEYFGDSLPIVGSGGTSTPEDAIDWLRAGASLIESYAAFVFRGPEFLTRTTRQLLRGGTRTSERGRSQVHA